MSHRWISGLGSVFLSVMIAATACKKKDDSPTGPTASNFNTSTFTPTGSTTMTPTHTGTATVTKTPTASPSATVTPTLTATWTRTITPSPTLTGTPTGSLTATNTSTPIIVCTVLVTPTPQPESEPNEFCETQYQDLGSIATGGQIVVTGYRSSSFDQDTFRFQTGSTGTYNIHVDCVDQGISTTIILYDDACSILSITSGTNFISVNQSVTVSGRRYKIQLMGAAISNFRLTIQSP